MSKTTKVLVLTSSFPRHKNDWWQRTILCIYSNMDLKKYSVTVVAPTGPDSLISEKIDGINVRRFNYFYPRSLQVLTSGEGILYSFKVVDAGKVRHHTCKLDYSSRIYSNYFRIYFPKESSNNSTWHRCFCSEEIKLY